MHHLFETAGGSILGRNHRLNAKNNQDAFCCLNTDDYIVAIVCDGCGSGEHSEVGAKIGARLVARFLEIEIKRHDLSQQQSVEFLLKNTRLAVLKRLRLLAKELGSPLAWAINNYLLFTVIGALLTPQKAIFFSLGDGLVAINGEVQILGPFADNAPPYLSYGLAKTNFPETLLRFEVERIMPAEDLDSFLIGSDGVSDLIHAEQKNIPSKSEKVGPLSQFWHDDKFFKNPDIVRRRLSSFNRDITAGANRQNGLLPDDTTLVVGRRKEAKNEVK